MPQPSMRNALVEAARVEFHEHGYAATGIAAIASRAAAHKGSFYNHFASKEELAAEVVRLYAVDQRLDTLVDRGLEPLERIRSHFGALIQNMYDRQSYLGCLLANFSAEVPVDTPLIRAEITGSVGRWAELVAANLDEAARAKGADVDSAAASWMLIDGFEGAALRCRVTASAGPLEAFMRSTLPLVLSPLEA